MVFDLVAFLTLEKGVPWGLRTTCGSDLTSHMNWSLVDCHLLKPKTVAAMYFPYLGLTQLERFWMSFMFNFNLLLLLISVLWNIFCFLCFLRRLCFCFAAQQWCRECYKHINGQHFCRSYAAGITPKPTYVNLWRWRMFVLSAMLTHIEQDAYKNPGDQKQTIPLHGRQIASIASSLKHMSSSSSFQPSNFWFRIGCLIDLVVVSPS